MKIKFFIILLCFFHSFIWGNGKKNVIKIVQPPNITDSIARIIHPIPFQVGEKLKFEIKYGFIKAAYSTMEIPNLSTIDGNLCYHVKVSNRTTSFFDKVYKVRDVIETHFDYLGIYSWRYEKHLREGNYKQDRIEIYDQTQHVVKSKNKWRPIEPFCMDALCALYYIRTQELIPGKDIYFNNHTDGKNYFIRVIVHKKEIINTELGDVKTIKIEPVMVDPGVFKSSGKITIWLTDDSLKVPVKLKSKVFVGSFAADIIEYENTKINFIK